VCVWLIAGLMEGLAMDIWLEWSWGPRSVHGGRFGGAGVFFWGAYRRAFDACLEGVV